MLKLQGQLGEVVEIAITPGWAARDPQRALDLALALPEQVADADGHRLVLFFDEFQELASARYPYGDPDAITKRMRAPRRLAPAIRDRVLKSLLQAGIVEHAALGDWRIVNPLLREYLRRFDPLG